MQSHEFGRHTFTIYDEGISFIVYRGTVSLEDMKVLIAFENPANPPEVSMIICDVAQMGKLEASARRLSATTPKPSKRYLTAYLGAGFAFRTVIEMWTRATNLLHGHKYVVGFFDDTASARVWLLAQKEAFLRDQQSKP